MRLNQSISSWARANNQRVLATKSLEYVVQGHFYPVSSIDKCKSIQIHLCKIAPLLVYNQDKYVSMDLKPTPGTWFEQS